MIWGPSVAIVGRTEVDATAMGMMSGSPDWTSDAPSQPERLIEFAGRTCYDSFRNPRPGGNAAYIGHILEVGHGSVLEHACWSIYIAGVSRSLTHELVRHRAGMSYSQHSQRFIDESGCSFVVPPALFDEVRAAIEKPGGVTNTNMTGLAFGRDWLSAVRDALFQYQSLVRYLEAKYADIADRTARRKAAREAARSVLPNCTETRIVVTGNGRSWRHFLEMRGSAGADAEIRRLAIEVLVLLKDEAPNLFGDMSIQGDEIVSAHRKV